MKIIRLLHISGALLLLAGAVMRISYPFHAACLYMVGAVLFAVMQFVIRYKGHDFVLRRLSFQQQIGGILLVAAGVLMFTHSRNEWIVAMFVGALIELYTAFRISRELEKRE